MEDKTQTNSELKFDIYRPEYGQGIGDCIRAVYGEGYAVKTVYDPPTLQREFELGNTCYGVAIDSDGIIVGCEAMYRSSPPFRYIYEIGGGVVIPAYRGRGIQHIIYDLLFDYMKKNTKIEEVFGEPVCNHTKMQKMVYNRDGIETAIEIDLVPAETFIKEDASGGRRVSTILSFRCVKDKPQDIFVPEVYRGEFEMLYKELGRQRKLLQDHADLPSDVVTAGDVRIFEYASVSRLAFHTIGKDLDRYIHDHDLALKKQNIAVSQVFLPLDCTGINKAVQVLRSLGYFLGGILPRWFDSDGMLMQKILHSPNWSGIRLYSSRAERILGSVKADWEKVSG